MKKLLLVMLSFAMVFSLASCGGSGDTPDESAKGGGDGVADVCFASEPSTIDPALNSAVDGGVMLNHAFEGLIRQVDDGKGNAILEPGIAESWDVSEDGLEWTFHLRENAKWSDGKPVTAQDFFFAWNRLVDPKTTADYQYMLDMVAGYDKASKGEGKLEIEAVDEKTFKVKLNTVCPYFEEICAFPSTFPVRADILEAHGDEWTFTPETYVSNGPYKMQEWKHNSNITFVKNPEYWDAENVKCETVKFHLMDDVNAQFAAFRGGELDYMQEAPENEVPGLIESGEMTIEDYIGTYYVTFNTSKAPFDDPRVREAFTLAIDRSRIVKEVTGRGEVEAGGFVPNGIYGVEGPGGKDFRTVGGDYYKATKDDYEANCKKAKELLAEAGYPDGEGFPVIEYLYNTSESHKAVGEALQNMWQTKLGVQVTLQNQDWGVFLEERKSGNYQIARAGWIGDYNDPMTFLDQFLTGGGNNDPQYANPKYDKLIKAAKKSMDSKERMKLMHEAEDILIGKDYVVAPIYYYTQPYLVNEKMKGMYYTPLGFFFFKNVEGM